MRAKVRKERRSSTVRSKTELERVGGSAMVPWPFPLDEGDHERMHAKYFNTIV